ncbi:MAG: TolC family protein [Deltaproteobacteria bacterium]|nr:TolC family protein [Deltaproteobacteria bacterium]
MTHQVTGADGGEEVSTSRVASAGRPLVSKSLARSLLTNESMLPAVLGVAFATTSATAGLTLRDLLAEVSEHAPQLLAQDEAILAARAGVAVAGAWEDPLFSVMIEDVALRRDPAGPMEPMLTYKLSQPLNLFGRRGLAKEAASGRLSREEAVRRRVDLDGRFEATMAFYDLWMNQEMRALLDRQIATLERMKASAKAQYEAGLMMGHHDFLRAEAEIAAMQAERASLADQRGAAAAMLEALRGRAPGASTPTVALSAPAPIPEGAFVAEHARDRPELEALRAMRFEASAERSLAKRMYLPMIMAGAMFQQRLGIEPNSIGGEVALTIPLFFWDRQAHEVEIAEAMLRRAERELEAMTRMTEAQARGAWSRARAADRALRSLDDVALPRMRESVASSESAYASGAGNFLSLLDVVLSLQGLEARRIRTFAEREVAVFDLQRLLGTAALEGARP